MESADPTALYVSVLSLGEIRRGIELLRDGKKRRELEAWVGVDLRGWFGSNLLPISKSDSQAVGELSMPDVNSAELVSAISKASWLLPRWNMSWSWQRETRGTSTEVAAAISPREPDALSLTKPTT